MNDEKLFEMLETCVEFAVQSLKKDEPLDPFAMILEADDRAHRLHFDESDPETLYTRLHEALRAEAKRGGIKAAALLARVNIPEHLGSEIGQGIRIHVEMRADANEPLSARLLYIPYQLFRSGEEDDIGVHLHPPISVGMPADLFA